MLPRVRRGDLALTMVAVAGLAAGMVLTIVRALGVTGPLLIGASIIAAVAAVVPGARSQVSQVREREKQQSGNLAAVLAAPIQLVMDVDPFLIGVFPSALAQAARQDRDTAWGQESVPPYVPRSVDAALRRALEESSLAAVGRLVVLRGDPKSGKSRSLWEAVRTLPGRRLLAVTHPDPAAAPADPGFEPLATLAGLDRPLSSSKGCDLVIWVDDAHRHLQKGLSRSTLRRLAEVYPGAVIAMTINSPELDGLRDVDPHLHALLRRHFDDLVLGPELSSRELDSARSAYPVLAGDSQLVRLPELFAAVNLLIDRYRYHRADQPAGVAVAKAAVDWQRAGMPPGSIDGPTLQALAGLTLAEIAPSQDLDDEAFKLGLGWAGKEIAVFAALIQREPAGGPHARHFFRAFDAVVSWAAGHEAPLSRQTWDFVIEHAASRDLLGVGISAYLAGEWDVAIDAFQRAAGSASSPIAAGALIGKAVTLGRLCRPEEELTVYDQVVERFGDAQDPVLAQYVGMALVRKGLTLGRLSRPDDELAAYDQVVARFTGAKDPAVAEQVAVALSRRRSRLRELGRSEGLAVTDPVAERHSNGPGQYLTDRPARDAYPATGAIPPDEASRVILLLSEQFMLLHLRSQIEAFRSHWSALSDLSPAELAMLDPGKEGPAGLGYGRQDQIDGVVGVIAWSVVGWEGLRSPRTRMRRIRREADLRRIRPEVSDALARFLTARLGDELPGPLPEGRREQ